MLPVGGVGQDQAVEVVEDPPERLRLLGWLGGKGGADGAGLDGRQDVACLDGREVVRHRVDRRMGGRPEALRVHVRQPLDLRTVEGVEDGRVSALAQALRNLVRHVLILGDGGRAHALDRGTV